MRNTTKILLIIPAYNEMESIEKTLTNLLEYKAQNPNIDICVVNDGSKDKTADIVKKYDVTLLDLPINLGIGGAVQMGYKYAYMNNYDIAIQFDADGQHKSCELDKIINPVENGEADMCIGSRFKEKTKYKGSFQRRAGIYYFEKLLYALSKEKVTDPTSGFRAVNNTVLSIFVNNYPKDYPEPEVIMLLKKKGLKIKEVSVEMDSRESGTSSITPFKSIYYMLLVSLSIIIQKIKREG